MDPGRLASAAVHRRLTGLGRQALQDGGLVIVDRNPVAFIQLSPDFGVGLGVELVADEAGPREHDESDRPDDKGQVQYQELLRRGVIVRPVANYGLPEWLRVTVGLAAENARFLDVLPPALATAQAQ